MAGRPSRYTKRTCDKIIAAIAAGASRASAARAGGIDDSTLYEWMNAHPDFGERVREADDLVRKRVEEAFFGDVTGGKDWRARLAWLQARYPSDWSARSRLELTGKDGGPVQIQQLADAIVSASEESQLPHG